MCILHFQLMDLDLWNAFCEVSPWGNVLFTLPEAKQSLLYATLGMRLWCKYIRNYLLVYQLTSHFLPYLRNYKEIEGGISDLQLEKYGLSFETKKYTTSGWAGGGENVIRIRAFNDQKYQNQLRNLLLTFFDQTVLCSQGYFGRHFVFQYVQCHCYGTSLFVESMIFINIIEKCKSKGSFHFVG